MPIFEYRCKSCENEFEKLVFRSDDTDIECPSCHSPQVQKKMSAASIRTADAFGGGAGAGCAPSPSAGFG